MLSIFGVALVLYFVKILSGSKNYQVSFHVIKAIMSKSCHRPNEGFQTKLLITVTQ
jgi:hypothetical protein